MNWIQIQNIASAYVNLNLDKKKLDESVKVFGWGSEKLTSQWQPQTMRKSVKNRNV